MSVYYCRCNNCSMIFEIDEDNDFYGGLADLLENTETGEVRHNDWKPLRDPWVPFRGCPRCMTDDYLMDIDGPPSDIFDNGYVYDISWQEVSDHNIQVRGDDLRGILAIFDEMPTNEIGLKRAVANNIDGIIEILRSRGYRESEYPLRRTTIAPTPNWSGASENKRARRPTAKKPATKKPTANKKPATSKSKAPARKKTTKAGKAPAKRR